MKRRKLLKLLAGTPAVWPVLAFAQQTNKVFRVGLLSTSSLRSAPIWVAFEQRMRDLGYVEEENWIFEFEGTIERFVGDSIMVLFNDPLPYPEHELRPVAVYNVM